MQQRQKSTRTYQNPHTAPLQAPLKEDPPATVYRMRPIQLVCGAIACVAATLGITGTAGYYVLRNDMIADATAERTELVMEYQDHIDRLRTEIETLTSRQMVDRETVEIQVMDVLRRQQDLNQRHAIVADLVARAESVGIYVAGDKPVPPHKPVQASIGLAQVDGHDGSAIGGESELIAEPVKALGLRDGSPRSVDPLDLLRRRGETVVPAKTDLKKNSEKEAALSAVKADISVMDIESTAAIDAITVATESRIDDILGITRAITPSLNTRLRKKAAIGGPFQPLESQSFPDRLSRADTALKALRRVKFTALRLPIKRPVRYSAVTSSYGPRVDPFLGRLAMHSGMDFKAPYGARVNATAPGTVMSARRHGGYGNMVEIRHANGFVTRYAHLSRFQVSEGDHVLAGDPVGNVGSTGRSTGPHLHYEIRRNDKPHNPAAFLTAGEDLAALAL